MKGCRQNSMVPPDLTRRQVLKGIAALGALGVLPRMPAARPSPAGRTRILAYLRRHARPDGGYAFDGQ